MSSRAVSFVRLLLGAAGGLPLALTGCLGTAAVESLSATPALSAPTVPASFSRRNGIDCLMNQEGIQAKVLAVAEGVRCLSETSPPPHGEPVRSPLAYFRPYCVFDVSPRDGTPAYYLIGPTTQRRDVIGWAPVAAVARWDTRVGARAVRDPARRVPPVLVYPTKEALIELLEKGSTDVKPVARTRAQTGKPYMPWPIVEVHRAAVRGQVHELVRLHFLAELKENLAEPEADEAARSAEAATHLKDALQKVRRFDLVIVVDCTGSMQPYIEAVKATLRDVARQLAQGDPGRRPDVAFALVAYRDHDDAATSFVTRHFGLDSDIEAFLAKLNGLSASQGGDMPEALYDGVWSALTETPFRQGAHKVIVVVADSSAHEPGDRQNPRNLGREKLIATARDHVVLVLELRGQSRAAARNQARVLLHHVGFDDGQVQRLPSALSGGQQQRVAIARAVAQGGVILADEPTGSLDPANCWSWMGPAARH